MKQLDFAKIKELAEGYKPDMTGFLRDMIRLPSESRQEKAVAERIKKEMEKVGFDKVEIDPMGNVLGTIGKGKHLIAMDAHIDTVGVGNKDNWEFDPYEGYEDDDVIGGRGASDQEGGMASMVYAGKIGRDFDLETGQKAARICGLNLLAALRLALGGSLDGVEACLRLGGFVNAAPDFTRVPAVINGASDLMAEVFGPEAARHARTAVGVATLPQGAAVEVDAIFAVR